MKKVFLNIETGAIIIAPFNSTDYENGHTTLGNGSRLECLSIIREHWASNLAQESEMLVMEEREEMNITHADFPLIN